MQAKDPVNTLLPGKSRVKQRLSTSFTSLWKVCMPGAGMATTLQRVDMTPMGILEPQTIAIEKEVTRPIIVGCNTSHFQVGFLRVQVQVDYFY